MAYMARKYQPAWFKDILEEINCHQLHPEYDGYLYNHITHGVIALYILGADESRVTQFTDWYKNKRNVTQLDIAQARIGHEFSEDVSDLMGTRQSFHEILVYYDNLAKSEGVDSVVRDFYPSLGTGFVTGLLHGLIHLGYGCSVKSQEMMIEGLAYLHYAYEPFSYDMTPANEIIHFGKGLRSFSAILESIRKNTELRQKVESFHNELKHLNLGLFQPRLIGISHYMANDFIQLAHQVKLPDFFSYETHNILMLIRLTDWITLKVLDMFCRCEIVNDFVILHGVIGCWALRHILTYLKFDDALVAVRNYMAVIFAIFTMERCCPLSRNIPELKHPLQEAHWQSVIKEITAIDADEHVFKLSQVCYCLWNEGYKGSDYDAMFVSAIKIASKNTSGYALPDQVEEPQKGHASQQGNSSV